MKQRRLEVYTVKFGKFGEETKERQFTDLEAAKHFAASKERIGYAVLLTQKVEDC